MALIKSKEQLLEKISNQGLLSEDGILIIESLKEDEFKEEIGNLRLYKTANYGITKISYYERVLWEEQLSQEHSIQLQKDIWM